VTASLDDLTTAISLLQARALIGFVEGDFDEVRSAASEGVRLSRGSGDLYRLEMMLFNLGLAIMIAGDLDESKPLFRESLSIARRIDDRVAQYLLLDVLGCHAVSSGQAPLAARLLGAAETVRTGVGAGVTPILVPLLAQVEDSAIVALGARRFQAEFEAGKRLDRDTAISLALDEPVPVSDAAVGGVDTGPLGKREAEVARLVADGLSNKQIGTRLHIRAHRRQPPPQHNEQARVQHARPDRRLGAIIELVAVRPDIDHSPRGWGV